MNKTLLLLASAATLSVAACTQEHTTDTATTTPPTEATMPADGAMPTLDADYRSRASRIADRMASDMKITDTTTVGGIRTAYYYRVRRLDSLRQRYGTDTAGLGEALRSVNSETDQQLQAILTAPTQYETYQSNRTVYDDDNRSDSENATLKVKADGDVKIKDAQGNKTKLDADDGTVKLKPEDGKKTVIK